MVNSKVLCFCTTVLAYITVTEKHLLPAEPMLLYRAFHHIDEPYYCWDIKSGLGSMNFPSAILQHLCFTTTHKAYGPTDVANIEGFIILIKKQNR